MPTPHGDNHDLWVDSNDPARMIEGNDGGACVSFDSGASWSSLYNQPTAQFYHLATDGGFPIVCTEPNRTIRRSACPAVPLAGLARAPSPGASATRLATRSAVTSLSALTTRTSCTPAVLRRAGEGVHALRPPYRAAARHIGLARALRRSRGRAVQAPFPVDLPDYDFSPQPGSTVRGRQLVFRSDNEGQSWVEISPDLTRNDPTKLDHPAGRWPLTNRRGELLHRLCIRRVTSRTGSLLGGLRRRPCPCFSGRWRELGERHAAEPAGVVDGDHDRGLATRPGLGLRSSGSLQAG